MNRLFRIGLAPLFGGPRVPSISSLNWSEIPVACQWQRLDEQTLSQDIQQERLIRVADRESYFLDYIHFLRRSGHRFVLRAAQNRRLKQEQEGRVSRS